MNWRSPGVGALKIRAPGWPHHLPSAYTPDDLGIFAGQSRGDLFDPLRKTPITTGPWRRALLRGCQPVKRAHYFFRNPARTCTRGGARMQGDAAGRRYLRCHDARQNEVVARTPPN